LFLLSVGWINQERSINSVVQIYDKEECDGLIYETDEAGMEVENHYQGVIAIRSQNGSPQKSGDDVQTLDVKATPSNRLSLCFLSDNSVMVESDKRRHILLPLLSTWFPNITTLDLRLSISQQFCQW